MVNGANNFQKKFIFFWLFCTLSTKTPVSRSNKIKSKFQDHFESLLFRCGSFTYAQLSTISASRYWNSTIHTFCLAPPEGVFARCLARWNFLLGPHFFELRLFMSFLWAKIMLGSDGSLLVAQLSAQTTSPKMPVLAKIFRVPRPSVCWHLNRRISTGSCRMKTTKWSYIIESSRLFIFRSQIFFLRSSSPSTVYFNVMMTSPHQASS